MPAEIAVKNILNVAFDPHNALFDCTLELADDSCMQMKIRFQTADAFMQALLHMSSFAFNTFKSVGNPPYGRGLVVPPHSTGELAHGATPRPRQDFASADGQR